MDAASRPALPLPPIRLRQLLAAGRLPELVVGTSAHRKLSSHNVIAERRTGDDTGPVSQLSPVTMHGSSDHEVFEQAGIAAGNFSWRDAASPRNTEPQMHTPEDTIAANISAERLKLSMEMIGAAAYATLRDPAGKKPA
jgi:hypothetical protein